MFPATVVPMMYGESLMLRPRTPSESIIDSCTPLNMLSLKPSFYTDKSLLPVWSTEPEELITQEYDNWVKRRELKLRPRREDTLVSSSGSGSSSREDGDFCKRMKTCPVGTKKFVPKDPYKPREKCTLGCVGVCTFIFATRAGCQQKDQCRFAHSLEEFVGSFYQDDSIRHYLHEEDIAHLDHSYKSRVCSAILTAKCENTKCAQQGRALMSKKEVALSSPPPSLYTTRGLPACEVHCKECECPCGAPIALYNFF